MSENQVYIRFNELIEEIHKRGYFRNKTRLYSAIGLDIGQVSRTRKGKRKIEELTLNMLKYNVPSVNLNWLFSGAGTPFLDDDSAIPEDQTKLKEEIKELRAEVKGLKKLLQKMKLKEGVDITKMSMEERAAYMLVLAKQLNKKI